MAKCALRFVTRRRCRSQQQQQPQRQVAHKRSLVLDTIFHLLIRNLVSTHRDAAVEFMHTHEARATHTPAHRSSSLSFAVLQLRLVMAFEYIFCRCTEMCLNFIELWRQWSAGTACNLWIRHIRTWLNRNEQRLNLYTHINFFDRQIAVEAQHIVVQYHVRVAISWYFMNIPEHSVGHQNSCVVINQQWLLWNRKLMETSERDVHTKCIHGAHAHAPHRNRQPQQIRKDKIFRY